MAICNGQKPEELTFDIPKMRRHLFGCLEDRVIRHFPAISRQRRQDTISTEEVEVYCKCRLQDQGDMINCEGCKEWFHSTCEDIPAIARKEECTWMCSACT